MPSLFTFNVNDHRIAGLAGVAVEDVTLRMESIHQRGPILVTHWGLSGPVVLRVSAWGARELYEKRYQAKLIVNWLGDYPFDRALEVLQRNKAWSENMNAVQFAFRAIGEKDGSKIGGILITGPFDESDVKELLETLRAIERRKPQETFMLLMNNDAGSNPEMQAFIERVFPAVKGVPVEIVRFEKK